MRSFRDLVADNQQDSRIKNLLVGDIMTRSVVSVYTNTPLSDAVKTMLEHDLEVFLSLIWKKSLLVSSHAGML